MKICTRFSNWGEALCASETCETFWCMIRKAMSGSWMSSNSKEPGRSPPGTQAPPGQVPGDTAREKTPNNNMIQSLNSKTIYTQLSRAVTRCSEKHEIKISIQKMQVWNTSPVLSLKRTWATQDDPRPALHWYIFSILIMERQLQGNKSLAEQNINPGHIAACRSPTGVATRDDPAGCVGCLCVLFRLFCIPLFLPKAAMAAMRVMNPGSSGTRLSSLC